MKKLKYLLTLFFLFPLILLAQQSVTISGKVTDAAGGLGIPGVSVRVKGTNNGTLTNSDGTFSLNVPGPDSYIQFTSVGFAPQEIQVNNKREFQIILKQDNNNLEELIVVGYGTQKKLL
ncbi:carboxypeptidase-like regulatory domain-containing protein [Pedobacter panaciterrae]